MSGHEDKADLLFKSSLGFPSTNKDIPFYKETLIPNNYILGEEIFIDEIPNTFIDGSSVEIQLDNSNIVTAIKDVSKKIIK